MSRDNSILESDIRVVDYVEGARAEKLANLGISTVRDLLCFYPYRYIDLTAVYPAASAPIGETVTVVGMLRDVKQKRPKPRLDIIEAALVDESGMLMGVWFRQPWMMRKLEQGARVAFTGKVAFEYGFKRMNTPHVELLSSKGEDAGLGMIPVHHATEGLSAAWVRRIVSEALAATADIHDPLPAYLRERHGLMGLKQALRAIHFPSDATQLSAAKKRLAFGEVFMLQIELMNRRRLETAGAPAFAHETHGSYKAALLEALPFALTDEQAAAVEDIASDMEQGLPMNRMLLGDVGTGKTAVAALALAMVADSGSQAAMMAPTEVLAQQYATKLGPLFDAVGIEWALLTGSTPVAEREVLLERLAAGETTVLFGTHALIEPPVVFSHLTLAIIDEQHRFGVSQRAALRAKGPGSDLLVMTATPIPRTLALTIHGDLSCSFIRKRPASRPDPVTRTISRNSRGIGYDAIREAVEAGRQAYIICPLVGLSREQRVAAAEEGKISASLISGSDICNAKAAEDEAEFLARKVFPGYSVGLLTGRMRPAEKERVMKEFREGSIAVLVATTVVEVGVDVPNATVMIIEDAERFGLSQLHQLRGRISRGSVAGELFLVADPGADDDETRERMNAMESTTDGFELAEADLRYRREGDVLGLRQSGASTLKLVNILEMGELIAAAHEDAREYLLEHPDGPEPALAHELEILFTEEEDAKGYSA